MRRSRMLRAVLSLLSVALAAAALTGCGTGTQSDAVPGGNPEQGKQLIASFGCGSCHTISGVDGANGKVGPALTDFADELTIAGRLSNTPDNAIRWIMHPQEIAPGVIMPDLGVSESQARDIVAYLYGQ